MNRSIYTAKVMREDIESIENASTTSKSVLDSPSNRNSSKYSRKRNSCHKDFATTTSERIYVKPLVKPMLNNRDEFPIIPIITDPTIHQPNWEEFIDNILTIEQIEHGSYIRIKWYGKFIYKTLFLSQL